MKITLRQKAEYAWYLSRELWPWKFNTWMALTAFGGCIWGVVDNWHRNPDAAAWAGLCAAWVVIDLLHIFTAAIEDNVAMLKAEIEVFRNE